MRFERDSRDRKVILATEWIFSNFHATIDASNIIVVSMFFSKITAFASNVIKAWGSVQTTKRNVIQRSCDNYFEANS